MEESCWGRAEKKFIGDRELIEHVVWVIHVDIEIDFNKDDDNDDSSSSWCLLSTYYY